MPKYLVKSNISKDGMLYEVGSKIELSSEQAAEMPWAVVPIAALKKLEVAKAEKTADLDKTKE